MRILVINCGSSSIKYKLFFMPKGRLISGGLIEHIGENGSKIKGHYSALKIILKNIKAISAIGHRVVHGAEKFKEPVVINQAVIRKIRQCSSIAPLHNPANLSGILSCQKLLPQVTQIAVFDTAFYQTLPDYAYIYGLPYAYYKRLGIRKYGFHGTSHKYVAHEASRILKRRLNKLKLITCHLGNGASITAVNRGRSIDTSMGFTPLEGLVMGTRCGDIDPALVTYLMQKIGLSILRIDAILNKDSGLKGISGISNDMRVLLRQRSLGNRRAKLAIDIFTYRIRKYIGAYALVMGGCDAIVFTGGIGENQKSIREGIVKGISSYLKSSPKILVIPTDEELMIARETYKLIKI